QFQLWSVCRRIERLIARQTGFFSPGEIQSASRKRDDDRDVYNGYVESDAEADAELRLTLGSVHSSGSRGSLQFRLQAVPTRRQEHPLPKRARRLVLPRRSEFPEGWRQSQLAAVRAAR